MHVEVTRVLTQWLRHEDFGVVAMLTGMTHKMLDEDGDPIDEPIPTAIDIYNDVDFDLAQGVLGVDPPTVPSLVVVADSPPEIEDIGEPVKEGHAAELVVGVGYYAEKDFRAAAMIAGNYVLRAVKKSLRQYNRPQQNRILVAQRTLNDVLVAKVTRATIQRVAGGTVQNSALLGFLLADVTVIDKAP